MSDQNRRRFRPQFATLAEFGRAGTPEQRAEMRKGQMVKTSLYTWEVQRQGASGLWSHRPPDPRGAERSALPADRFAAAQARALADVGVVGEWRLVVWDTPGVGAPPVAVMEGTVRR
jgi:hypothetical protein